MTKTQIKELEIKYYKYKFKKRLLQSLFISFVLILCSFFYAFYLHEQKKNEQLKLAQKEKARMLEKLELAKIKASKNQILAQKNEPEKKIQIHSYHINIQNLKKDFYAKPNFKFALELGESYFQNQDYEKAIFWALKANEFDSEAKEPWLIFAKAKKAQGYEQEAIKILENYINFYGADEKLKNL